MFITCYEEIYNNKYSCSFVKDFKKLFIFRYCLPSNNYTVSYNLYNCAKKLIKINQN